MRTRVLISILACLIASTGSVAFGQQAPRAIPPRPVSAERSMFVGSPLSPTSPMFWGIFGRILAPPFRLLGTGSIQVVSRDADTGEPVRATWVVRAANGPSLCSIGTSACAGMEIHYVDIAAGTYTLAVTGVQPGYALQNVVVSPSTIQDLPSGGVIHWEIRWTK